LTGTIFYQADLSGALMAECDLTGLKLTGAVLKSVDLKGATLTGALFDQADLSGALMVNATFNSYTAPAKKAAAGQGAQLGRALAKAVGKGLCTECRGGDSEDEEGDAEEDDGAADEEESIVSADDIAYALEKVASTAGAGLEQLLRARAVVFEEFQNIVPLVGASNMQCTRSLMYGHRDAVF
jgi:uncharacterized protein YjbI with pentapeptide repeats